MKNKKLKLDQALSTKIFLKNVNRFCFVLIHLRPSISAPIFVQIFLKTVQPSKFKQSLYCGGTVQYIVFVF